MAKPQVLRFGIQSLDRLIGTLRPNPDDEDNYGKALGERKKFGNGQGTSTSDDEDIYGIDLTERKGSNDTGDTEQNSLPVTSSICLAGPDGTGKSVLSLHLASRYLADCLRDCLETQTPTCPNLKVLYISTDLNYKMALKGWTDFLLDRPLERREPLVELRDGRKKPPEKQIEISLQPYSPSATGKGTNSIVGYLENKYAPAFASNLKAQVCFVDLAASTAGDDWGFVHRLLSTLDEPDAKEPRHLVILDAVEGFETLVGDLNAFGEKSTRRSRIAQVMRLAAAKCHLLLVVEEGHQQRFPEEFVTDVVIRLRNVNTGRYLRRTVEIEKARGQWHRRGQHPYVIRNGAGSTTGNQPNADDPEVFIGDPLEKKHQSYIHVYPSLDDSSREIMLDRPGSPPRFDEPKFAAFGLPYLDNMLGGEGDRAERDGDADSRGLDCGSATALIGDSLTQKSQLGKAFLSRTFYSFIDDLSREVSKRSESQAANDLLKQVEDGIREIAAHKSKADQNPRIINLAQRILDNVTKQVEAVRNDLDKDEFRRYPVAILFTTHNENDESLAADFYEWLRERDGFKRGPAADESNEGESTEDDSNKVENAVKATLLAEVRRELTLFVREYEKYVIARKQPEVEFRSGARYKEDRDRFKRRLMDMGVETTGIAHIKDHTICRRFEIHDLPAPVLMNIFQRSIEDAQRKMLRRPADKKLPKRLIRRQESWRIRVVIDDLNTFRNTYPDIREDPLMLPSLLFMFNREGVTSLIVDTQASGSPELSITERFDSSVRQLVETRIYIWRLSFYGENRVAISVIPPKSHDYRGLIRELRWDTTNEARADRALTVDPHFELYSGLETAQPRSVPLEVRLYSDTASAARYIGMEERILREIFTPVVRNNGESRVILPAQLHEYEPLRDTCHIQRYTRLDHTTILQVNEFWWLRRLRQRRAGAFRPQWNYLNSVTATFKNDKFFSEPVTDPFWVFQPAPAELPSPNKTRGSNQEQPGQTVKEKRKLNFFDEECGYGFHIVRNAEKDYIDRVPYTWDFGFLLCNEKAWKEARNLALAKKNAVARQPEKKVGDIWDSLGKATDKQLPQKVTWREFLAASKVVAEFQSFRTSMRADPFDFTMLIPESFSCLILEMWLSESYDSLKRYEERANGVAARKGFIKRLRMLKSVGRRRWTSDPQNQVTLLRGLEEEANYTLEQILNLRTQDGKLYCFSLELYKVWLLLTETLNFADLVDSSSHLNFEFRSKDVSPNAVSARHWYKTASSFIDSLTPEQVEYNWVPVRLPGHFSVRADWFLAVAGGSRSNRTADHAMDLLSSQRANVTRLQEGIGLPTRKLFAGDKPSGLRTRLIWAPEAKALENLEYDALRRIGAQANAGNEEFFWLWRSRIWAYNRHSRVWHKWLNRALLWWHSWHQRYGSSWATGFEVYDLLDDIEFGDEKIARASREKFEALKLDSWQTFHELRNILISELNQVSISVV